LNGARTPWLLPAEQAALLAHELGNPLGIARLCTQDVEAELKAFHIQLLELAGEDLDPAVHAHFAQRFNSFAERIDTLAAAQQRMAGLVEELRAQGQGAAAASQTFDLGERLRAALRLASARSGRAIELGEESAGGAEPAQPWHGPLAVLDRVLLNLAINAVQAIERRAEQEVYGFRGRLRGRCQRQGGHLVVEIDDNGIGIAPQEIDRVFERGFSRRRDSGGSGLGLSYAREAIRALGGDIGVASLPGQGTRFRLWLPADGGQVASVPTAQGDTDQVHPDLDP
jgi:signal transduction histidine kinase